MGSTSPLGTLGAVKKLPGKQDVVAFTFNPSTQEAETGGFL